MSNDTLSKPAADVCKHFPLGEKAKELIRSGQTVQQFMDQLLAKEEYQDAVRLLAHALPKQEAVWWGCLCCRATAGANPPAKIASALQAAEKWAAKPSEDNRRAAQTAAEAAEMSTPAGCAAMAAFWSGGSLGPANVPAVPPGEHLTAHGVTGAILLAAVLTEPEKAPEKYRKFLTQGLDVARGVNRWK